MTAGLLLDTHVWVWLMEGSPRLGRDCVEQIQRAAENANLWVSAISVWEVAMLERKGRLRFAVSCEDWVTQALATPGVSLAPINPDVAIASTRLPDELHGDPADRLIAATARSLELTLVTADGRLLSYAALGHLQILPVTP